VNEDEAVGEPASGVEVLGMSCAADSNGNLSWLGSYLRLQNKFRVVKVKDLTMWAVFLQRDFRGVVKQSGL